MADAAEAKAAGPSLQILQTTLVDESAPIAKRIRSVFYIRQIGGDAAVEALATGLRTKSVLLSHEVAYVLGQLQNPHAIPFLVDVLRCPDDHPITRHECAEALAAIGKEASLPILEEFSNDPASEVAETCRISIERINWNRENAGQEEKSAVFKSVDPAPPSNTKNVADLKALLLDTNKSHFERYRAMFALRNLGTEDAVVALGAGFVDESPVFRHEICYIMGQLQHVASIPFLQKALVDPKEHAMVRHEAAEALGSIGDQSEAIRPLLADFQLDKDKIVGESCDVALDIADYWATPEI